MKQCISCQRLLHERLFYYVKKRNYYLPRCASCENKKKLEAHKKRKSLGYSIDKPMLKYQPVLTLKKQSPEMSWASICKQFNIKYGSFKAFKRTRNIINEKIEIKSCL